MSVLAGRVAIVTGAARGIGRCIAEHLGADGADVVLVDLDKDSMEETANAIKSMGHDARRIALNVADGKAVDAAIAEVMERFGRIDILVNNAGITRDTLLMRMSEEQWDSVINVNLKGTFLFTKAVARPMMKQRSGVIINMASVIGQIGNAGQANYAASKAGVIAFTKSVARELASRGIRVNAIAPGFIQTDMTDVLPDKVKDEMMKSIPSARLGTAHDVAHAVRFLVSDEAAYVTGQVHRVCGGMVM